MHQHFLKCEHFMDIMTIRLPDSDFRSTFVVTKKYLLNNVLYNFHIVGSYSNWSHKLKMMKQIHRKFLENFNLVCFKSRKFKMLPFEVSFIPY